MANRYAVATGDWSDTATWDGGPLPTAGDVVRPNNFTVTIDQDVTGVTLMNDASSPAVAGGTFIVGGSTTRTLTLEIEQRFRGYLLQLTGTGIVNLVGNVDMIISNIGGAVQTSCVDISANCTFNHTGNAAGSGNTVNYGIQTQTFSIRSVSNCTFTGNYLGGFASAGATPNSCIGVFAGAQVLVNGTVVAGPSANNASIYITSTGAILEVNGEIRSSNAASAIVRIAGVLINALLISGQVINVNGVNAINSNSITISNVSSTTWLYQTNDALEDRTMYTADELTGYPLEAKVEDGTVFGPSSEFEGTLEPWDAAFAQALATAQRDLQLPSILSAITAP